MEKVLLKQINFIFLCLLFISCKSYRSDDAFYSKTLGLNIEIVENKYNYTESAGQNEGLLFSIDSFRTKNSSLEIKESYPSEAYINKDWGTFSWQKTPCNAPDSLLEILFHYDIRDINLQNKVNAFNQLLSIDNNYFSFYYKKEGNMLYCIKLFFVDTKNKHLYTVIINT